MEEVQAERGEAPKAASGKELGPQPFRRSHLASTSKLLVTYSIINGMECVSDFSLSKFAEKHVLLGRYAGA